MGVFRVGALPNDWQQEPPPSSLQQLGDRWAKSSASVILAVPSVIIPNELNYLINPKHPDVILLASDQGAVVTVNGGQTWSSWYNQPTAQFYHVATDNAFPYRVCGGQQEIGRAHV